MIMSIKRLAPSTVAEVHMGSDVYAKTQLFSNRFCCYPWEYSYIPAASDQMIIACCSCLNFEVIADILKYLLSDTRVLMVCSDVGLTTLASMTHHILLRYSSWSSFIVISIFMESPEHLHSSLIIQPDVYF